MLTASHLHVKENFIKLYKNMHLRCLGWGRNSSRSPLNPKCHIKQNVYIRRFKKVTELGVKSVLLIKNVNSTKLFKKKHTFDDNRSVSGVLALAVHSWHTVLCRVIEITPGHTHEPLDTLQQETIKHIHHLILIT